MRLVPDASAMVEVLRRTAVGRSLLPRLAATELYAPELLDVEVASALRRAVIRGAASEEDARQRLTVLRLWPIRRIPHRHLVAATIRWWSNVTVYDGVYLAVAQAVGASVLTIDGPLARAAVADVVVENVRLAT